jgi:hypothetical protein
MQGIDKSIPAVEIGLEQSTLAPDHQPTLSLEVIEQPRLVPQGLDTKHRATQPKNVSSNRISLIDAPRNRFSPSAAQQRGENHVLL